VKFARFFLAAALCIAGGGCRRVPPPPYPRAFAIDGRSPRVLESSSQTAIPVSVTNTGSRAWNPSTIHLSYHWLWIVPREIASRSRWDMPYHEGIRTDLGSAVAPGQHLVLQGRVLAPDAPGLYWLQWDMVEDGVVWFAQVAPRQPRTLVVVFPPLVWILAPLPFVVAIAGAVRRKPDVAASYGDVWWCTAALFVKPFVIIHDALLEPMPFAYWLLLVCALVPPALALLLPRRVRAWTLFALGTFASVLILGDVVYYRFFGDVISTPALLGAHQTGHVGGSIRSLFTPGLLWLIVDLPAAFVLVIRLSRASLRTAIQPPLRRRALAVGAIVSALAVVGALLSARVFATQSTTPMNLDQMFRNRSVVEQLGPFGFHVYDAWNYARATLWRPVATETQVRSARAWFADRAPMRAGTGDAFGIARGKNLIVVQVESLQDFVVDFRVGDQEVMPHLRRWTDDSVRFVDVTDETGEGRTSDAEFATMASLLPLDHGAVAFRYPGNHYVALPRVLGEHGYSTLSAVSFERGFWNRGVMHPSYGFQQSLFEPDFQMTEQNGWGLNDRDFLQQMLPHLERLAAMKRPFAAWMITLSLHHPFEDFPQAHKELTLGTLEGTSFGNYLHTMRFFDRALEDLRGALARDGLLADSVVVVFGDHDAGFARDAALGRTIGIGADAIAWALNDRIPWFVRVPGGADRHVRGARAMPAGQTDFAPTLLALLGIDASNLPYVGRNLLGAPGDAPVLRPYGDWIDSRRLMLTTGNDRACYALPDRMSLALGACRAADDAARRTHDISRIVVTSDLQQRLRDDLARP